MEKMPETNIPHCPRCNWSLTPWVVGLEDFTECLMDDDIFDSFEGCEVGDEQMWICTNTKCGTPAYREVVKFKDEELWLSEIAQPHCPNCGKRAEPSSLFGTYEGFVCKKCNWNTVKQIYFPHYEIKEKEHECEDNEC